MDIKSIKVFKGLRKVSNTSNNQDGYFSEMVNIVKDSKGRLRPYYPRVYKSKELQEYWEENGITFLAIRYKEGVLRFDYARYPSSSYWEAVPYYSTGSNYTNKPVLGRMNHGFMDIRSYFGRRDTNCFSHAEVDRNLYINKIIVDRQNPSATVVHDYGVYKFDGEKFHRAGLPTPSTHVGGQGTLVGLPTSSKFLSVYVTPDLNGGMTVSDYAEYESWFASGDSGPFYYFDTLLPDFVGVETDSLPEPDFGWVKRGIYPKSRSKENVFSEKVGRYSNSEYRTDYPDAYILLGGGAVVTPDSSGGWISVTFDPEEEGNKIFMGGEGWLIGGFMTLKTTINNQTVYLRGDKYDAYAFYIRPNEEEGKIFISKKAKAYNSQTFMWEEIELYSNSGADRFDPKIEYKTMATIFGGDLFENTTEWLEYQIEMMAQTFVGIYRYDENVMHEYVLDRFIPLCRESEMFINVQEFPVFNPDLEENFNDTTRPILGQITYLLADWYNTSVKKVQFPPLTSITNYKNLLVGCDDNAIYFSHTGFGGSIDMTSGQDNLVPPGANYGKLTGVCGSEEFLLISRERKNYVLTGDLVNGGFLIHECDLPVSGMATANSAIASYGNRIIFINTEGVWEVSSAGNIRNISSDISDLFNPSETNNIRTWVSGGTLGYSYRTHLYINPQEALLYITFMSSNLSETSEVLPENLESSVRKVLILNLLDMTWGELRLPDANGFALHQIPQENMTGFFGGEDIYKRHMFTQSPPIYQQLRFDWMSDGSQALDKKVSQLKFYGPMRNSENIKLKHWIDWNDSKEVTDVFLTKEPTPVYQREKKLTPSTSKVISFELSTTEGAIVLDQVDVEGHLVQSSIKSTRRKNQDE